MAMLDVDNVHTYYGNIHALKGISITVEEGEIVTLIGGNGAGKSTTLKTISGLMRPREGHVRLNGEDLSAYNFLTLQVIAKGTDYLKAEIISKDNGLQIQPGANHGFVFKLSPGFNTYKLPLSKFTQPDWTVGAKISPKDLLKKLTSVNISATTIPSTGQVVVDNVIFEK